MRVSNNATAHDVVKNFSQLHYPEERLAVVETTYTEFIDRNVELLVAKWDPTGQVAPARASPPLLPFRPTRRTQLALATGSFFGNLFVLKKKLPSLPQNA